MRSRVVLRIALAVAAGLALAPARAHAWQDLHPDFVRQQVAKIADPKASLEQRRALTWALASTGRAAVHPLARLARTEPRLLWTCVGILDLVRTDAHVVETFSAFMDGLPGGLADTGEIRGFLGARLEDMLGRTFPTPAARRAWVKEHARWLVFDAARLRFVVDEEARRKNQPMLHYPYAPGPHQAVGVAFWRLLLALHLGQVKAVEAMLGPQVKLVRGGGRVDTRPELDLDAFAGPPHNHRALLLRDEGQGRWLVRTGAAYLFFEGDPPRCVKAGMKPIE
jgi:hypothetical protein